MVEVKADMHGWWCSSEVLELMTLLIVGNVVDFVS